MTFGSNRPFPITVACLHCIRGKTPTDMGMTNQFHAKPHSFEHRTVGYINVS